MDYTIDENFTLVNKSFNEFFNNSFNFSNELTNQKNDLNYSYLEFRDQSRFWIQRVLVPIISLIGVIGNSITIVIMTRRRMRSSTNSYLAALATYDMLYLIFTYVLSLSHYPNANDIKYYYYWLLWPITLFICDVSSNTSIWITVTFTIERYVVVCHPMRAKIICTSSRTRKLILIVSLVCFSLTLPTVFEWKIVEKINANNNQTYIEVAHSELGLNVLYKRIYYWLTVVLFTFMPLIILSVFNIFLIRSVRASGIRRETLTSKTSSKRDSSKSSLRPKRPKNDSMRQESHITIMLIAVVILFLICQLPTACVLIYSAFHDEEEETNQQLLVRGLGNIFNFLMAINSAGNFVLYCLLSQKYRRTFKKTFCFDLKNNKVFSFSRGKHQSTVQTNLPIIS